MVLLKIKHMLDRRREKNKIKRVKPVRSLKRIFILVIFTLGKLKVKKCTNKLTNSPALWRLGRGPAAAPGGEGGHLWLCQQPWQAGRGGRERNASHTFGSV